MRGCSRARYQYANPTEYPSRSPDMLEMSKMGLCENEAHTYQHIYIYIYRERERERENYEKMLTIEV